MPASLTLLDQFLAEEVTEHLRQLLTDAIADPSQGRAHFDFNRFEVTIDRSARMVTLGDVLDASDSGTLHLTLEKFAAAVIRSS